MSKTKGHFQVSKLHSLYYEYYPNKNKTLVIYIHGGPGGNIDREFFQYMDKKRYALLGYEQRGCHKSLPYLEMKRNTVQDNLEDLQKIIKHFSPDKPVILLGASYGTQLSVLYAKRYPDTVKKLVLVGLWLGDKKAINHLYRDTLLKYPKMSQFLFGSNIINISEEFKQIKKRQNWLNWLKWEIFLGVSKKKSVQDLIMANKLKLNPNRTEAYYSVAFFESFYFSRKDYLDYAITYNDLKNLKDKIEIYHGKHDEVCPSLDINYLKRHKIKYKVISKMGHMPYKLMNLKVFHSINHAKDN